MLKSRYLHNRKAIKEIVLDVDAIQGLLSEGESLKEMLAGGASLTFQEAKQLMLNIEKKFASTHAHTMTASSDPEVRELFELLAKQDRQHADLLGAGGG